MTPCDAYTKRLESHYLARESHYLASKILRKHCFHFLLGLTMVSRESKSNAYAKFWRDKKYIYFGKPKSGANRY